MSDDQAVAVRRIVDLDLTGFNNVQIDVGLARPKNGFTVRVLASRCQRFDEGELGVRESRKRDFFCLGHGATRTAIMICLAE